MPCHSGRDILWKISVMVEYHSQDVGVIKGKLNFLSGKSSHFSIVKYF